MTDSRIIELTADIVSAHVANNDVAVADVPALIQSIFDALTKAENPAPIEPAKAEPAVPIRSSVKHDYIICLEDGAKLKILKRYLRTRFDMSPEDYRAKWGLPKDYPMVAPAYAEKRRTLARSIGLGHKKIVDVVEPIAAVVKKGAKKIADATEALVASAPAPAAAPKKRGRPPKAATTPATPLAETAATPVAAKPAARKKLGIAGAKAAAKDHLNPATTETADA